jgi:hypothetical protein
MNMSGSEAAVIAVGGWEGGSSLNHHMQAIRDTRSPPMVQRAITI